MATHSHEAESWPAAKVPLLGLPLAEGEAWEVDVRRAPAWAEKDGDHGRPWLILVAVEGQKKGIAIEFEMDGVLPERIWKALSGAMLGPSSGGPRRPAEVLLRTADRVERFAPRLAEIGIRCDRRDRLPAIDAILSEIGAHLGPRNADLALVHVPGIDLDLLGALFEAAAELYRLAPWDRLLPGTGLGVDGTPFGRSDLRVLHWGEKGQRALFVVEDLESFLASLKESSPDESAGPTAMSVAIFFGLARKLPIPDLDAAEENGWPVAAADAWPHVVRMCPGGKAEPPDRSEVEALVGCLLAMRKYLAAGKV